MMESMKYPKINTLWKRDDNGRIIIGEYAQEEFKIINKWQVTEKVDGMNIRVGFKRNPESLGDDKGMFFYGRTDQAMIPGKLSVFLKKHFTYERFCEVFDDDVEVVWLFGEGYGPKIQNGDAYADEQSFVLFDVVVDGIWLERDSVNDIAEKFDVKKVPFLDTTMDTEEINNIIEMMVNGGQGITDKSSLAIRSKVIEGFVCRPKPLLFDRRGKPVLMKLKLKDFGGTIND
jgi:ATP-dependent RNA circularization protein (DNA/RNA ligase family)